MTTSSEEEDFGSVKSELGPCSSKQADCVGGASDEIALPIFTSSMTIRRMDSEQGDGDQLVANHSLEESAQNECSDEWCLTLIKGSERGQDSLSGDVVSVTQFNRDGSLCAVGDKSGRITIYRREEDKSAEFPFYHSYVSFVSHLPEFDYLKSLEIEEKINKIKFLDDLRPSTYLLSTNDKTIKLWKIVERRKCLDPFADKLSVPKMRQLDVPIIEARSKAVYKNGHTYHVNSVSPSSDGETFISADDLRINLWHLDVQNQLYNIVDMKPANMEDITEVITCAECHPTACNLFAYTSSKGCIRLCDMRTSALCDQCFTLYEVKDDPSSRSFFSEIISSISDIRFSNCGKYMLTRDYMYLRVWDCRQQTYPVEHYPVHPHVKQKMCSMYENDYIFDKFDCSWSGDDRMLLTGSYGNLFTVADRQTQEVKTYRGPRHDIPFGQQVIRPVQVLDPDCNLLSVDNSRENRGLFDELDYSKRILHCTWSPDLRSIITATDNHVYFYSKPSKAGESSYADHEMDGMSSLEDSSKHLAVS